MTDEQTRSALEDRITSMSSECERGPIAIREDGHAGIALTSPNSLMFAWSPAPGVVPFFDFYLN